MTSSLQILFFSGEDEKAEYVFFQGENGVETFSVTDLNSKQVIGANNVVGKKSRRRRRPYKAKSKHEEGEKGVEASSLTGLNGEQVIAANNIVEKKSRYRRRRRPNNQKCNNENQDCNFV